MTKKEIVRTISEEVGLTQEMTKKVVQKTFDAIVDTLVREGRIELRNFGVFEVRARPARRARNPTTGKIVHVPPKRSVSFKPGKEMEARVQQVDPDNGMDAKDTNMPFNPLSPSSNEDSKSPPNAGQSGFESGPAPDGRWDDE